MLLGQSPWARDGFARMDEKKREPTLGYAKNGKLGVDMPDPSPNGPPGGLKSVPIGEPVTISFPAEGPLVLDTTAPVETVETLLAEV